MLLIVAKMMEGDPISFSLYRSVYMDKNPEILLTHDKVMHDPMLKEAYFNTGASVGDEAKLNAEYWLTSEEAHYILCTEAFHEEDTDLLLPKLCDF